MDAEGNESAARDDLAQMEQVRWVLGGLLDKQDLRALWPVRVLLTKEGVSDPAQFVSQCGQYLLVLDPSRKIPTAAVAKLFLDANTPQLPPDAERGLLALFSTLEAHGSKVTWGGPPPTDSGFAPDLAFARMQLFATKWDYRSGFHILVTSLKSGSSLPIAEKNAFGRDPKLLEQEAEENLKTAHWEPVSVSGRPLDPKRDLGEHALDGSIADVYLGYAHLNSDGRSAEAAFKAGIEAGGVAGGLGYAGLGALTIQEKGDPEPFFDDAVKAGDDSAYVLTMNAQGKVPADALPLLKRAAQLNPMWAQPVYDESKFAKNATEKEALLKKAALLDPRATHYWLELAQLQDRDGHAIEAQSSWLRAEDSAPDEAERARISKLHDESEQERLDAADQERADEREAAHREDQRARDAEEARIQAAEQKANAALDQAGGEDSPKNVVAWDDTVAQHKLTGTLANVLCFKTSARISVLDKRGKTTQLSVKDWKGAGLSCGVPTQRERISVTYAAEPDEQAHTAGRVLALKIQ